MRIVSWNLGHQTQERPLKAVFFPAIRALCPDVLILNEYVDGISRTRMKTSLATIGLAHLAVSESIKGHNQILIASRHALALGALKGPQTSDASVSNFLHVHIPDVGLELVGLRAPAYSAAAEKVAYWASLSETVAGTLKAPIVYIGDLNADPESARTPGGRALAALEKSGWQIPRPVGEWSYRSSRAHSRIDHAIVAPSIAVDSATYSPLVDSFLCAGTARELYDHAPLLVEIEAPAS
jgi:exonuclease III